VAEELTSAVRETSQAVLEALSAGPKTAWELKMRLKVAHSRLHMAIGVLVGEGKIEVRQDGLDLRVSMVGAADTEALNQTAEQVAA